MNKKILKIGSLLFAMLSVILLVGYIIENDHLLSPYVAGPFFLILFGACWGTIIYLALPPFER